MTHPSPDHQPSACSPHSGSNSATSSSSEDPLQSLVSQLKSKLDAGNGETLHHVGAGDGQSCSTDQQFNDSVAILARAAGMLGAEHVLLRSRSTPEGRTAEYLIRIKAEIDDFHEVRVAVVGNVDAGKSTLLGVLTHGDLDNGRGLARQKLFRHKHELESGRTSSIGNDILGFDSRGNVVNQPDPHGGHLDWVRICEKSSKVLTFIDLAGHEKYLKTTIFGMTGHSPDFTMLMIGANAGVVGMTKEHLGLALALSVPVFVVITKIDMCPENVLQNTIKLLHKVLKSAGCRKIPVMVQTPDDVILAATNFATERLCPIFQVSNVYGTNLDLLKIFMNLLMPRGTNFQDSEAAEFQIDDHYSVPGVGTVVSGLTLKGIIKLNDVLCLGPDSLGHFVSVAIKSIHRKRMPVREVRSGQTASFALKKIKRSDIRKGMVLVSPILKPQAFWEFEGEILVLHHPTTISPRYQAMVHCGSVRQTASILSMSVDYLRTGDKAKVHFRFMKNPEYIRLGQKMVFREGRTKAIGTVTAAMPGIPPSAANKGKKMVRQPNEDQENAGAEKEPKRRSYHRYDRRNKPFYADGANVAAGNAATTATTAAVVGGPVMQNPLEIKAEPMIAGTDHVKNE